MQIFVKLGLRTHESSDGRPANRRSRRFANRKLKFLFDWTVDHGPGGQVGCEVLTGLSGNLAS